MHWAVKYIGMKYTPGGRGPDAVDCWGLLRLIYQNEFSITLPELVGASAQSLKLLNDTLIISAIEDWVEVSEPFDGCAVGLSQHHIIHHVGIFAEADGGKIIHCWRAHKTIADTFLGLRYKQFQVIKFYRHRLWPL